MKLTHPLKVVVSGITSTVVSIAFIAGTGIFKAQAANLVVNGKFTADSLLNPNDSTRNNPFITGWFNSTQNESLYTNFLDNYTVDDADQSSLSVRLAAYRPDFTYISQNLNTVIGQKYKLSYYLANSDEDQNNTFRTYVGGNLLAEQVNLPLQDFQKYEYDFVATSNFTELKFSSYQFYAWYNLDNVNVTPVPEPSMIAGIGVLVLIPILRKRKQTA
ncbi:PEP-CTERM sorting domain-containing protein [Nostoc sp. FACHB-152]|uniref:PEP-CTERM sorting domain-containing protein n=1 Tax=unclassified Nostoc TaxID=2593658 RepID=UPI001682AF75|nr:MULTISPECIES: PEP-CTERM sorting domain-containing protein [unclassified Nostoc]MBD2450159.1 PEP-CTERM sorting domain-containing protein [Nostoc sp. FACHB-152]MBD2471342.1 PEP-CTERM sorting domain-containing protein [Nostoc sp. FACHB-145]